MLLLPPQSPKTRERTHGPTLKMPAGKRPLSSRGDFQRQEDGTGDSGVGSRASPEVDIQDPEGTLPVSPREQEPESVKVDDHRGKEARALTLVIGQPSRHSPAGPQAGCGHTVPESSQQGHAAGWSQCCLNPRSFRSSPGLQLTLGVLATASQTVQLPKAHGT